MKKRFVFIDPGGVPFDNCYSQWELVQRMDELDSEGRSYSVITQKYNHEESRYVPN